MTDWMINDSLCEGIIAMLKSGKVETRDFLKPIFKWLKSGNKHYNPDKAFQYVEWMITIRDLGDNSLDIERQPHIQPKYAYNTIVTMCQRNSDHKNAMRAYHAMIQYSFEPDVFTMTALLDVIGRNGRFHEAIDLYKSMIESGENLPNVVTFVTLIRVASNLKDKILGKQYVQILLDDAHRLVRLSPSTVQVSGEDGNVVISIYNAALSACVRMNDIEFFGKILYEMTSTGVEWTGLTYDIVSKFYYRRRELFLSLSEYLEKLVQLNAISTDKLEDLNEYIQKYVFEKDTNTSEKKFYAGCLGPDAPQSLRVSVMVHDLKKLIDRLDPEDTSQLTESDFVTLLHQCRKRRWCDQIEYIISQMEVVSIEGVPTAGIAPVIHLTPSRITYEAALDGYFHASQPTEAWSLFLRVLEADIDVDESFLYFVVWGFMRCGDATLATQACLEITKKDVQPTVEIIVSLFRGLGRDIPLAFTIFSALFTSEFFQDQTENCILERIILTLLESSAVLGNPAGICQFYQLVQEFPHPSLLSCFQRLTATSNSTLTILCIMAASNQQENILNGFQYLLKWQQEGIIPPLLSCYTLALEFFASCLDGSSLIPQAPDLQSLPFRGFMRFGSLKYADIKLNYMSRHFSTLAEMKTTHPEIYKECTLSSVLPHDGEIEASFFHEFCLSLKSFRDEFASNDPLLPHFTSAYKSLGSLIFPELFLQYLSTKMLFIRSKQDKTSLVTSLAHSLNGLSKDIFELFFCDLLKCLSNLDITGKQQAKLISLLLNVSETKTVVIQEIIENLLTNRRDIQPCIDVLKELCKNCSLLSRDAKRRVAELLLSYMKDKVESPIRIVQMLKPFDLFDSLDLTHSDITLVDCYLEDPNGHWMALITYIGDHEDKNEACRRVCRLLLERESSNLVLKILTKFQFFSDTEFQHLFNPSEKLFLDSSISSSSITSTTYIAFSSFPDLPLFVLSQFPQQLIVVDNFETLNLARSIFEEFCLIGGALALDSEWRPFSPQCRQNKCSLLQVAINTHVFLFDLMILEPDWQLPLPLPSHHHPHHNHPHQNHPHHSHNHHHQDLDQSSLHLNTRSEIHRIYSSLMRSLLSNENIVKIGYRVHGDIKRLQESYPTASHYTEVVNLQEVNNSKSDIGLDGMCRSLLGYRLDKRMQRSDWEQRPLSAQQTEYAALDAVVLLELWQLVNKNSSLSNS